MSLHDVMLSNDDLLAAIDLTVDFHGNEASVEEHGMGASGVGAGLDDAERREIMADQQQWAQQLVRRSGRSAQFLLMARS